MIDWTTIIPPFLTLYWMVELVRYGENATTGLLTPPPTIPTKPLK